MDLVKAGRQNTLPTELDVIGQEIAALCGGWARNVDLKLYSYEEALDLDSGVAHWISFAKDSALGIHAYVLEDGPELLRVPRRHADEGGGVLEAIDAEGCTNIEESRIIANSGMAGGQVSGARVGSGPAGIVSKDARIVLT
jgi:hypothetical protein